MTKQDAEPNRCGLDLGALSPDSIDDLIEVFDLVLDGPDSKQWSDFIDDAKWQKAVSAARKHAARRIAQAERVRPPLIGIMARRAQLKEGQA